VAARVVADESTRVPNTDGPWAEYEIRTLAVETDHPLRDVGEIHSAAVIPALEAGYFLLSIAPAPGWGKRGCLFYVTLGRNHR
jgi:hypothetical protein